MFKFKKEPVYKETTSEDSWFTKKWNTPRGRAALKLGIYGIVVLILLIMIAVSGSNTPREYNVNYKSNKKTYEECLQDLKHNNYDYEFKITGENVNVIFKGQRDSVYDNGYKEDANGIIKYSIEQDTVYQVNLDERIPIDNLYENVSKEYLTASYILSLIEDKEYVKENTKYTYTIDDMIINVVFVKDNIESINFIKDNLFCDLKFSNVGKNSLVKENTEVISE